MSRQAAQKGLQTAERPDSEAKDKFAAELEACHCCRRFEKCRLGKRTGQTKGSSGTELKREARARESRGNLLRERSVWDQAGPCDVTPRDRDLGPGPEWIRVDPSSLTSVPCRAVPLSAHFFLSRLRLTRPWLTVDSPVQPATPTSTRSFASVYFPLAHSLGLHSAVKAPLVSLSPHPFPATLPLVATTDGFLRHGHRTSARPGTWQWAPFLARFDGES